MLPHFIKKLGYQIPYWSIGFSYRSYSVSVKFLSFCKVAAFCTCIETVRKNNSSLMIASIPLSNFSCQKIGDSWQITGKINHGLHFFCSIHKISIFIKTLCFHFFFFISRNTLLVENVIIGLQNETQKKQARKQTN